MRAYLFVVTVAAICTPGYCQAPTETGTAIPRSLFEALGQGDMAKVRDAINNGMDVNSRDAHGATLLMQAAAYGTTADLDFLLAHGADVNATNKRGHTAVLRAMPDLAKIKLLVEGGANVNAVESDGNTPLLIAAFKGNLTIVKLLLEADASVNVSDDSGLVPLMMAANSKSKDPEVVRLLLGRGADVEAKDGFGRTASDWGPDWSALGDRENAPWHRARGSGESVRGACFQGPSRGSGEKLCSSTAANPKMIMVFS